MRRTTLFAISFILSIIIIAVYSFQHRETKITLVYSESPYIDDVVIKHRKEGMVKWMVDAKKAVFNNTNEVILKDLTITFPEKKLVLTSDEGVYNTANQNIKIEGNIKALKKNYVINASTLSWNQQTNELFSDKKIQIIGREFYIEGDELLATPDKAKLNSNVRAVFQ